MIYYGNQPEICPIRAGNGGGRNGWAFCYVLGVASIRLSSGLGVVE